MKKYTAVVKMCETYSQPIAPDVKGMKVGDKVEVWASDRMAGDDEHLVCIKLTNGKTITMSQVFCRQHLKIVR